MKSSKKPIKILIYIIIIEVLNKSKLNVMVKNIRGLRTLKMQDSEMT
jgi:hypothetical protein